jgi:hypothetical protein
METYQWFLLGVMVTWTPSLVVLALMLSGQHSERRVCPGPTISRCLLLHRCYFGGLTVRG